MNYKIQFLLFLLLNIQNLNAHNCGNYRLNGIIIQKDLSYFILVNKGTKSEYQLKIPSHLSPRIIPYLNKSIYMEIEINKNFDGMKNEINDIYKIEIRIANPLKPRDTFLEKVKNKECLK